MNRRKVVRTVSDLGYLPWRLAERFADAPAVRDDNTELTFTELDARTNAIAAQLQERGFRPGDVLAIMLPNRVELLLCIFAAWRLGGTATPVNSAFTVSEAGHQVTDSGATLVVAQDDGLGLGVPVLAVDELSVESGTTIAPHEVGPDDVALLVYTSGSTGRPKGVMLTHANTEAMTSIMVSHFALTPQDHCLLVLPLFHVNAVMVSVLSPLRAGGQVSIVKSFSPATFFDSIERVRPTYFSAVPTIYALLVALPTDVRPDTSSLRFVVCGAAPVTRELLEASQERYGFVMVEGYGLTEGTCASACNPIDGVRKLGTVGPALPDQRIAIVSPEGHEVPTGETGEILISGPTVMRGYLGQEEATAETIVDGWLRTGDVGRLDEDGYLQLIDRVKDMIIRGGENLYPKEIETTLAEVEGVLEVAVVGRADDVMGEVPVAFVVTYPDATTTVEQLLDHCRVHLTRTKVPADIQIVGVLPKNPVGKIDKPGLRERLVSA